MGLFECLKETNFIIYNSILGICTRYLLNIWLSHNLRPWRQAHIEKNNQRDGKTRNCDVIPNSVPQKISFYCNYDQMILYLYFCFYIPEIRMVIPLLLSVYHHFL